MSASATISNALIGRFVVQLHKLGIRLFEIIMSKTAWESSSEEFMQKLVHAHCDPWVQLTYF